MEEIISSSLFEMKEENEAFIQRFKKISSQTTTSVVFSKQPKTDKPISNDNSAELIAPVWVEKAGSGFKKQAVKAYQTSSLPREVNVLHTANDEILSELSYEAERKNATDQKVSSAKGKENETSQMSHEEIYRDLFVNQVLILQKDGLTTEEIAKKLGKGNTEIELLLKFSKKE
ncbi:hypothetical protein [Neobacillus sp. PS3-40]|uniref:hypothetical protein n=1 Tax=Neobacillus sp. PS3-40 TaxID=3070679 RepID=UPI0027DEC78B|nr:hypothetical protein [Neobacillus sp. PS3-40]WML43728.1 hypothetical protein RCG20_18350 [Neobacillus sp. PS3-40]